MDALEALHEEIRAHRGCGFELCEQATQLVPGEGDPDADVMLVGEAPGAAEDEQGRPFVGRAGKLLDELLAEAGLERAEVFITNVVKARPPGNRDPKAPEVAHHLPWLEQQLALIRPRWSCRSAATRSRTSRRARRSPRSTGSCWWRRSPRLLPWLHPAAALHNQGLRETLFEDARALPGVLESIEAW